MLYISPFLPFQLFPLLVSDTERILLYQYPCPKVRTTNTLLPGTSTEADTVVDIIDIGVLPFAGQKQTVV